MKLVKKLCIISNQSLFLHFSHNRPVYTSSSLFSNEPSTKGETEEYDILEELKKSELTEEEIIQKRFKSRLPEVIYRRFVSKEVLPIISKYDYKMHRLRKYYARNGKESNLNPGISWPTRQEISDIIEFEREFEPPLSVMLKKVEDARLAEVKRKQAVEAEVEKNMANLDKWVADYYGKIDKKKEEMAQLKLKKERLIEEISEYLGYDVDPRDPRFQEAVEQREKEKKKALKMKKQQESYDKMVARLKKMAEQSSQ